MEVTTLPITIQWHKFKPGSSFFIPCIDRGRVERYVRKEAKRIKVEIICKQVVENRIYGLRVWRIMDRIPPHSSSSPPMEP